MKYLNKYGYEIEAIHYTGDNLDEVIAFCGRCLTFNDLTEEYFISNKMGTWKLYSNDYIISLIDGTVHPQLSETFNIMYKRV